MQRDPLPTLTPLVDREYPARDGKPMSDNTRQFEWITTIQGGIDALFGDDPLVFVAGDCLWYPVAGNIKIRTAPDTMVIFGRPKGHRGSYVQHREGGIAPQVVFEVLSPSNRAGEMQRKLEFYETYGVEEYYILDPDHARHKGYRRAGEKLELMLDLFGWISPRLGIRFDMTRNMIKELRIVAPDGRLFRPYTSIVRQLDATEQQVDAALLRAEQEKRRADEERSRADEERSRADEERSRADEERSRAERLLAQLRALGLEPEA